jgi:hypothetical protein
MGRRTHGEDVCTGSWSHWMASVSQGLCSQLTTRGRKPLPTHPVSAWPLLVKNGMISALQDSDT